ncbi:MAG: HAD family acid phosphatase [Acidobacteriota bacterium]
MNLKFQLLAFAVAGSLACSGSSAPVAAPATEAPTTEAAVELPRSVHWMRNSAEYRAILLQTYAMATEELRAIIAGRERGTWAVALDADETVISNALYERELTVAGRKSDAATWRAWVARQDAEPLPGAKAFLQTVEELGGYIAIVTNRSATDCPDTEANFRKFDRPFDVMLCKEHDGEKESRWESVENGTASEQLPAVEIVMWFGDNIQDFPDHDQNLRHGDASQYSDFGRRYFIMPNPMYGSWQSNDHD